MIRSGWKHGFVAVSIGIVLGLGGLAGQAPAQAAPIPPFATVSGSTPSLYLGFDRKLPVDRVNLYVDVEEKRGEPEVKVP